MERGSVEIAVGRASGRAARAGEARHAVILAGGAGIRAWNASWGGSKLQLDLGGETVLERQCAWLASRGIRRALVVVGAGCDAHELPARVRDVELEWQHEPLPMGTAGALRDAAGFIGDASVLVLGEHVVPFDLELPAPGAASWGREVLLQVLVEPCPTPLHPLVSLDPDGFVRHFDRRAHTRDRRRGALPLGVFVLHPRALEHVPARGYFDLQEQLVPALIEAGHRVEAVSVRRGQALLLSEPGDVLRALRRRLSHRDRDTEEYEIQPGVWARGPIERAGTAQLVGPVLFGEGASVEAGARIVGPAYIGPRTRVESGALVRESWIGADVRIGAGAAVYACLLPAGADVKGGEALACVMRGERDVVFDAASTEALGNPAPLVRGPSLHERVYRRQKRVVDVVLASIGLVLAAPLMLLIAVAIRLDSPGPVFFLQRRCGKGGDEFPLVKFRTMRPSADSEQDTLRGSSERDGPVFKITQDPRITPLGALLRRTSLDELPQLVNVLLGHMSLVGPRPLRMEEMRYAPQWRDLRLSVKPGLTGPWQCHSRHSNDFGDWVRHDNSYVLGPASMARDLALIWRTALGLVSGRLRDR
jgi:lipopolysaccharide/colanic/teichoic acid biosynthesis glycosyltransferase